MTSRRWHYVKPNENSETIQRCIFVDTETDPYELDEIYTGHRLRFGWAAETRRNAQGAWTKPIWTRFTSPEAFWLWCMSYTSRKHKTWMWCHNSSFDYPVLDAFRHLPLTGWKLESAIIDAPPTVVKYSMGRECDKECLPSHHTPECQHRRKSARTLVLCDTLNIWRMSLKELGQRIGLEKLTRPEAWGNQENDDYYCRRDVEIILRSVTEWADFLRDNDMGGFCPTIAAQAMRSFRHRWLDSRILIDANYLALGVARRSYRGGRCEAHRIGQTKGPIYSLDVNSMYPFVMSYAEMPVRLAGVTRYVQPYNLPSLLNQYCLCAHVRLNTDKPAYGIIHDGKLCFPTGRFDAYLCTPEIEYAVQHGHIEEVHLCASYEKAAAFKRFALDLYTHKEHASRSGKDVEARHWKLLLNSFYGKWGQNGRHWIEIGTCDPSEFGGLPDINAQTKELVHIRHFGGKIYALAKEDESLESHPAIAAHICAHARMVLFAILEQAGPTEYLYCDTDGVLVTASGLDALRDRLDQHKLGCLKQIAICQDVLIYGCKDYVIDGKATLKGVRPDAESLDGKTYRQIKFSGMAGLLRADSLNMPLTSMVSKTLRRTYSKGVVGPDGWVSPLHFRDPSEVRGFKS